MAAIETAQETDLRLADYDYALPPERIAQTPVMPRDAARLLALRRSDNRLTHHIFRDLPDLLSPDDLLVVNETRVTAVRLQGTRSGGGSVEALLLRPAPEHAADTWEALIRPGRKVREGDRLSFEEAGLYAEVVARTEAGGRVLRFAADVGEVDEALLNARGRVPLPPYITAPLADRERYQTVYANTPGSAAAPTAGLHFTPELLERLRAMGIGTVSVRLDVGLGTFRPIRTDDITAHQMHAEAFSVPEETARAINACRGRVVAVGTTTLRALETAAREAADSERVTAMSGETRLFVRPAGGGHTGHAFRAVDALITNFHQPRSTLLLLVAAFAAWMPGQESHPATGLERLRHAYATALAEGYRFLSFGDAMFIY